MTRMLRIVAAAGMFAIATPAFADPPVRARAVAAAPNWSGFYAGIGGGAAWGMNATSHWTPTSASATDPIDYSSSSIGRGVFGFYAGYNWQLATKWVAGVEGDFSWTNVVNDNFTSPTTIAGVPNTSPLGTQNLLSRKVEWVASARGRVGYLVNGNTLLFATGGVAWIQQRFNSDSFYGGGFNATVAQFKQDDTGFVVGGGVEYMAMRNIVVRAEYLYYSLKGATASQCEVRNVNPAGCANPAGTTLDAFRWNDGNLQVVRVGIAYKL